MMFYLIPKKDKNMIRGLNLLLLKIPLFLDLLRKNKIGKIHNFNQILITLLTCQRTLKIMDLKKWTNIFILLIFLTFILTICLMNNLDHFLSKKQKKYLKKYLTKTKSNDILNKLFKLDFGPISKIVKL